MEILNKYIDYSNTNACATLKDIEKLCNEAIEYDFTTVYVNPYYVRLASELLKDTNKEVGTIVGSTVVTKEAKVYEAIDAVSKGANIIDMFINISAIKNKDFDYVKEEIEEIRDAIDGKVLKVLIDTNIISEDEIIKITQICNETYVNYIETNGYVDIINKYKNELLEIEVSGNIKTKEEVVNLIEEGATRIKTSYGKEIMEDNDEKN